MGINKFIKRIASSLGLKDYKKDDKKKSLKNLLKKLNIRKIYLTKSLKSSLEKKERQALQEDLDIISLQIKKGEKLLANLSSKK